MNTDTPLAAVRVVFDRARKHISWKELSRLTMNDSGHDSYVAAYGRILDGGMLALFEDTGDGSPLIGSFEITENLLLSHATAGESVTNRWFSVLTACIELLGASKYRHVPFSSTLSALLVDSLALKNAGVGESPSDILPSVCRELQQTRSNRHERVLALVAEVLTASLPDAEAEVKCGELHTCHEAFQQWYTEDGERNYYYAERPEFIWGSVVDRSCLPTWLALTEKHFPSSPALVKATRERLLREGNALLRVEQEHVAPLALTGTPHQKP